MNLFSVNLNSIRPFDADVARSKLSSAQGEALELALSKYSAWRSQDDGRFLRSESDRLDSERLKRQEIKEEADRCAVLQAAAEISRAEEAIRSRQAQQVGARSTLEDRHRARLQESGEAYLVGPANSLCILYDAGSQWDKASAMTTQPCCRG